MKRRYVSVILIVACFSSLIYAQNRNQAAKTLEERVTELESRVQALESKIAGSGSEVIVTSKWQDLATWRRKLRRGLTKSEVLSLFGEPTRVAVFGANLEQWYYGYPSGGLIAFGAGDRVESWSEPSS